MEITKTQLENICKKLTDKLNLQEHSMHVAAVFNDNLSDEIIGWGILDEDNNIVTFYNDIKMLFDM